MDVETAVRYSENVAKDDRHGYSQNRRKIAKNPLEALAVVDGDCASITLDGLVYGGFDIGTATYTGDMLLPLLAIGFIDVAKTINLKTGAGLRRGDILLRPKTSKKNGHTAFVTGFNAKTGKYEIVQAQSDFDGKVGDSSGNEIKITNYYNSPFTYVLRYPEVTTAEPQKDLSGSVVTYQTHVQNIGWMNLVADGDMSGTVGKSLRVEAIKINCSGIHYRSHVQDIGWQDFVNSGELSGTFGESKRLEAIEIRLDDASLNVLYQVHIQDIGWQDWKKNGETAGTIGQSLRIEAIRIKVEKKL